MKNRHRLMYLSFIPGISISATGIIYGFMEQQNIILNIKTGA